MTPLLSFSVNATAPRPRSSQFAAINRAKQAPTGRKVVAGSQPFHPHEAAPVTTTAQDVKAGSCHHNRTGCQGDRNGTDPNDQPSGRARIIIEPKAALCACIISWFEPISVAVMRKE